MNETPLFSVVMPVYNKEPHISRCVTSVLSQCYKNFELVLVCDPSTDGSTNEVAKFDDARIRVFHRTIPGPGGYAARNLGVSKALAPWIVFLDADDEMMCDHLWHLKETIEAEPDVQLIGSGWRYNEHGKTSIDAFSAEHLSVSRKKLSLYEYLKFEVRGMRPLWTSVVCVRKNLIVKAGLFPAGQISMGGDVDTWLRCVSDAGSMTWCNHIGAIYYRDSVNMVTKKSIIDPTLHFATTNKLLTDENNSSIRSLLKKRSNNIVIYAWNNNMQHAVTKNFQLHRLLYAESRVFRTSTYIIFALLPINFQKILYSLALRLHRRFM